MLFAPAALEVPMIVRACFPVVCLQLGRRRRDGCPVCVLRYDLVLLLARVRLRVLHRPISRSCLLVLARVSNILLKRDELLNLAALLPAARRAQR